MISGQHFRNPVLLAKKIMNETYHCALSGEGALKFAQEKGFPVIDDKEQLITQRAKQEQISYNEFVQNVDYRFRGGSFLESQGKGSVSAVSAHDSSDTVSAVARDANGHFACAVSNGMLTSSTDYYIL